MRRDSSRPAWYLRVGTVTAVQRREPWTWTSHGGDTMHADAGDWEVRDSDGDSWSVGDDRFRSRTAPGDWVVTGSGGEQWPVPGDEFAQRYVGPVSMEDEHQTE